MFQNELYFNQIFYQKHWTVSKIYEDNLNCNRFQFATYTSVTVAYMYFLLKIQEYFWFDMREVCIVYMYVQVKVDNPVESCMLTQISCMSA